MPTESDPALPEWNEENLTSVLGEVFQQAETDPSLRQQLFSHPFEALSTRIAIPDEYRGRVFAREIGVKSLLIHVPQAGAVAQVLPEGTVDATSQPAFEVLCTTPLW